MDPKYSVYFKENKDLGEFGNVNEISGPNTIGYFYDKTTNKKIVIMGETHGEKAGCGKSDISKRRLDVDKYIKELSKYENLEIDVFIEHDIPSKKQRTSGKIKFKKNSDRYVDKLLKFATKKYKKIPNMRFHFVDIRDYNSHINHAHSIYAENGIKIINFMDRYRIYNKRERLDIFGDFIAPYTEMLISFYKFFKGNEKSVYIPKIYVKEMLKFKKKNELLLNKLKDVVIEYIDNYLSKLFAETQFEDVDKIWFYGTKAMASISDLYTIFRIMKSDEFKNNIIYVGNQHYYILQKYLKTCGFEMYYEKLSYSNKDDRCIKIPVGIYDFFTNELK